MAGVEEPEPLTRGQAAKELQENYQTIYREPFTKERVSRILEIAQEFGRRAEPCDGGFVHVVARERSEEWPFTERFQLYNHANPSPRRVARGRQARYTSVRPQAPIKHMKESVMPARTRRAAAKPDPEPEVLEEEELEFDPEPYLAKKLTPTMEDYVVWWRDNVGDPDEIASELLITLGARFYNIFQKSDFNISRREERRAERATTRTARAAANGDAEEEEPEEEEAPAKPSRRAAAKPAGRRPAAKPVAAAAAPARPGRAKGGRKPAAGGALY